MEHVHSKHNITCHSKSRRNKKKKIPVVTNKEVDMDLLAMDNSPVLWWISFQIENIPVSQQIEQLKMWLVANRPSQVMRSSGVGWIAVKMTGRSGKNQEAKEEWDTWTGARSMETVNMIARKHGVTGGKWLCHVSREHVDTCWQKVAIAMFSGGLGPSVYMIKVRETCIFFFFQSR